MLHKNLGKGEVPSRQIPNPNSDNPHPNPSPELGRGAENLGFPFCQAWEKGLRDEG